MRFLVDEDVAAKGREEWSHRCDELFSVRLSKSMKRLMRWFAQLLGVPGFLLGMYAWVQKAHPIALQTSGIRIVTTEDSRTEDDRKKEEVWLALCLLERHEPTRMRRVKRYTKSIIIRSTGACGTYVPAGGVCLINLDRIPMQCNSRERLITIAALLVHEATHGLINSKGILYMGRIVGRIEGVCDMEQERVVNRLDLLIPPSSTLPTPPA